MSDVRKVYFYPADFFGGVAGMSAELIGVYWMVCTLLYMSDGRIAVDDPRLKANSGVSAKRLPGVLRELEALGKITTCEGLVTQKRVTCELDRAQDRIRKSRDAGQKGGRPPNEINTLAKPDGFQDGKPFIQSVIQEGSESDNKRPPASSEAVPPSPSLDAEGLAFREGKDLLGKTAGGLIAKLGKHFGGDWARALGAIRSAQGKQDPAQWIGAILRKAPEDGPTDAAGFRDEYRAMGVLL